MRSSERLRPSRTRVCVALTAVVMLVLVVAAPALAADGGAPGTDVVTATGVFPDVDTPLLDEYGLTPETLTRLSDGGADGRFRPFDEVTRAQFAKFLARACDLAPLTPQTPTFSDVPADHPLFGYVEAVAAAGIAEGVGGGLFAPDQSITRQQAAALLMRYLVAKNGRNLDSLMPERAVAIQLSPFADGDRVSLALRKEVALAVARANLNGSRSGGALSLRPDAPLLRIQALALATRQGKPRLASTVGTSTAPFYAGEPVKEEGEGIIKGILTDFFDGASDATSGDEQWNQVNTELTNIQNQLTAIEDAISGPDGLQTQLDALAALFQTQSDAIKKQVAFQQAQGYMTEVDDWTTAGGRTNYLYYTSPEFAWRHYRPLNPEPAATLQAEQTAFMADARDTQGPMAALDGIHNTIVPQGASDQGLLTLWVDSMGVGALTEDEVRQDYAALELFFCTLVAHQEQALQLTCDSWNHLEGRPLGTANGISANKLLLDFVSVNGELVPTEDCWFSKLQAEYEDYFKNVARFAVMHAKNVNRFEQDLLGNDALREVVAQANFLCCQMAQQRLVHADGTAGVPQTLYGLQAILIYPDGMGRATAALHAKTESALLPLIESGDARLTTDYGVLPTGVRTLVFDPMVEPNTLNVTDRYEVRRTSFGNNALRYPGATFAFAEDGGPPSHTAVFDYGVSATLQYRDANYAVVSAPGEGVVQYGCGVIAYQYISQEDQQWYTPGPRWAPRPLGAASCWLFPFGSASSWTDFWAPLHGNLGNSGVGDGIASEWVGESYLTDEHTSVTGDLSAGVAIWWKYDMRAYPLRYIGARDLDLNVQFKAGPAGTSKVVLADGRVEDQSQATETWGTTFGVRQTNGTVLNSVGLASKVYDQLPKPLSVTLTPGGEYEFFAAANASFKSDAGTKKKFTVNMGTSICIDRVELTVK